MTYWKTFKHIWLRPESFLVWMFVVVFGYQKAMTLPVMIAGSLSVRGLDFWKVASLSILAIIPPVVLAVVLSRYLVRGLTMGAIKE